MSKCIVCMGVQKGFVKAVVLVNPSLTRMSVDIRSVAIKVNFIIILLRVVSSSIAETYREITFGI